jgi:hypothetical protein
MKDAALRKGSARDLAIGVAQVEYQVTFAL